MSQEVVQNELKAKTQQLMDGPLKHIKAAVLAAALLPLASVAATPASAQTICGSGGVCGIVYTDTNNNGTQDGESGIPLAKVFLVDSGGNTIANLETNDSGFFEFTQVPPGTYTVAVQIPQGTQVNVTGVTNEGGFSVATTTLIVANLPALYFGFVTAPTQGPGTGTPGYWKNHPDAWPASVKANGITVGGITYTRDQAIYWLGKVGKDKTTTMLSSLVPAMLNVLVGNTNCIAGTIAAANAWMTTYGPIGGNGGIAASSYAWSVGEPLHQTMDAYNNGLLCAPHRQ
jgi:hypothetical protein